MVNEVEPEITEGGTGESDGAGQSVTVTDEYQSLEGLLGIVPVVLGALGYSKTAAIYTEKARHDLSQALIPVLRKYPWGLKFIDFLQTGSGIEEAALFFVVYPLAIETHKAVQLDKAALSESKQAQEKPVDEMPSVFGTNRPEPVKI